MVNSYFYFPSICVRLGAVGAWADAHLAISGQTANISREDPQGRYIQCLGMAILAQQNIALVLRSGINQDIEVWNGVMEMKYLISRQMSLLT